MISTSSKTNILELLNKRTSSCCKGTPIAAPGNDAAFLYNDGFVEYLSVPSILPTDPGLSFDEQALEVLKGMEQAVSAYGMAVTDIIRTWFYLDGIYKWYGNFNKLRTDFFRRTGVLAGRVPASTAIGHKNPLGAALAAGFVAARPLDQRAVIRTVKSPLQSSALDYGSSFSRGIELLTPEAKVVSISGTASIDMKGITLHTGDAGRQIEKTMEVVSAILESRGLSWQDVSGGAVYYCDRSNHDKLLSYCQSNGIPELPLAVLEADICRKDLLFEIELDACKCFSNN